MDFDMLPKHLTCFRHDSLESEYELTGPREVYDPVELLNERCQTDPLPSFEDIRRESVEVRSARRRSSSEHINQELASEDARLDALIAPGDVMCVKGTDQITRLGARGGFMGHVSLIVSPLRGVQRHSPEAGRLQGVWPKNIDVRCVWVARTLESTRAEEGFHQTELILYADSRGRICVCGEERPDRFVAYPESQSVEVWQAPLELRQNFRLDLMIDVLKDMKKHEASWSWATAIRAFLLPAEFPRQQNEEHTLQEVHDSWKAEPICTSVVLIFWQRYLVSLAQSLPDGVSAVDLILRWMPLRADRSLPGELLSTMQKCGWVLRTHVPKGAASQKCFSSKI
mmetsp:Transcript_49886/g.93502  ORF Transcript_49886/g.93502 Transcript_49886/m.93502 type:complete len:341 (+) Transcript_49886:93-1115(+)